MFVLFCHCTVTYTSRKQNEDDSGSGQHEDMRLYWAHIGVALLVFVIVLLTFDHTSSHQLTEKQLNTSNVSLSSFYLLQLTIDCTFFVEFFMKSKQQQLFRTMHSVHTLSTNKSKKLNVQNVTRSGYIIWADDALLVSCIGNRIMLFCWWCCCLFSRAYWAILTNYFDYHRCWAEIVKKWTVIVWIDYVSAL